MGNATDGGDCTETGGQGAGGGDHWRCGDLLSDGFRRTALRSYVECASLPKCARTRRSYARATTASRWTTRTLSQASRGAKQSERYLVQNIPAAPCSPGLELDADGHALPFTRRYHPHLLRSAGRCLPLKRWNFPSSITRGCFGGCNFCAIQLHQGRAGSPSRSADSVVREAEAMVCAGFSRVHS